MLTLLYNYHHCPSADLHPPKLKLCPHETLTPQPLPQLQETSILLSVTVNVTPPGTSDEWNHTAFALLRAIHLTEHSVLIVPLRGSRCQNFIPFKG